ncbi:hypothetical protein PAT3040_04899 [Paenibacillus agaridevorans]|uniref:Alpha-L-rhamnosidase n=1 Tax=Paenibacillus agaridevorans TaxID=171404 RepID=A0A2R5F2S6_9BACL|nr:family 78 glycoside hydrolase catalytic domain [Paenibacillus agaridevorans]GBG10181.1 hypothetical protein PAT3040_04899 [Paenibacillus agaridevorans]
MEEDRQWKASWIWAQSGQWDDRPGNQMLYWRKRFQYETDAAPEGRLSISADSRYALYVNGVCASRGPARGDLRTHYYETVDISSLLRQGDNVLAVQVLHYVQGAPHPSAIISAPTGALIVEGSVLCSNGVEHRIDTDESWLYKVDSAVEFIAETHTCVGGGETVEGSEVPHGWRETDYDDGNWTSAAKIGPAYLEYDGFLQPWQLTPRTIPPMYERKRSFVRVMRAEGGTWQLCVKAEAHAQVPPGGRLIVELDAGELSTGYLRFEVAGGAGARITFLCSESYESEEGAKGIRDQCEGQVLRGYREQYRVAGIGRSGQAEVYETFLFRTFRFVRLEIETDAAALTVLLAEYIDTGYPLKERARFACSDESLLPLWEVSIRSLQRCMHEGYYDCPYYEQLQYSMDTRLQALFTYVVSGDDRLARKALHEFHSSILPSGMLLSRYPSTQPQVIPGFALYWIMMVYDHLLHYDDVELAARYRPTIDAVLDWFGRRVNGQGLVGPAPRAYWSYVDWVKEWEATRGVPMDGQPLTVYNLMYACALEQAAAINFRTGRVETAEEYRIRAAAIRSAVNVQCWSETSGLYSDIPTSEITVPFSQHAQIWAILSGAAVGERAVRLAEKLLVEEGLLKASYSMSFFLFRALAAAGCYDSSYSLWDSWRDQLKLNLTTWLEDPVSQRSDCHAWGAVPLYEFTTELLGVKPAAIGVNRLVIEPQLCGLEWAEGEVATRWGMVGVNWQVLNGDRFSLEVSGADGVELEVRLPDGTVHWLTGKRKSSLECGLERGVS